MNVIFEVKDVERVVNMIEAKRILNNVYEEAEQIYVNGEKIEIDRTERINILTQLHRQIYV